MVEVSGYLRERRPVRPHRRGNPFVIGPRSWEETPAYTHPYAVGGRQQEIERTRLERFLRELRSTDATAAVDILVTEIERMLNERRARRGL